MHESGLCEAMVAATLRRANGRRVHAVRVRIGGHPVDPEVIAQGFRVAALGTVAEDATVDVVLDPMTVRCNDCGAQSPVTDAFALAACPRCGGIDVEATGHEDATLESITVSPASAPEAADAPAVLPPYSSGGA
jgi:hydrogenase nickel incorporation protein HypA/HybF